MHPSTAHLTPHLLYLPEMHPSTAHLIPDPLYLACLQCTANSVGFMDPGYIHTVVMSHKLLIPGRRYYYRYGSEVGKAVTA